MNTTSEASPAVGLSPETVSFYRDAMRLLREAGVPFLVGGAYAFQRYTNIVRHTKDFDLFIREDDLERAMDALAGAGYRTEVAFSHWLAKAYATEDAFVDLIFRSGNGVSAVDDAWFERAVEERVFDTPVMLVAPEEIIWTKAYIMERERFDGADVAHLILGSAERLDWQRLIYLFGPHWRLLLSHLVVFGFIYPSERRRIPEEVMDELTRRLRDEAQAPATTSRVCFGTLISRQQYLKDVREWGYQDARLAPRGDMTPNQIREWTEAIKIDGFSKE